MKKIKKFSILHGFFYFVVIIYGVMIVICSNFGVIDDHGLLDTLLVGKNMPLFISPEIGRFYPLNGFEYNLISKLSISPTIFYAYNSLQFFLVIFLLYRILTEVIGEKYKRWVIFSILILIFLPGFVTAFYRLFVPERNVFFFLVIFLFLFLKFQREQKVLYTIAGLIASNIALYYKEPVFIMLGSFAFLHFTFGWKELNLKQKIFDFLILASSFLFAVVYYFLVYLNRGASLYGQTTISWILAFAKNILNYFISEPIIFFFIFPLILWRVYFVFKNKKSDILLDSLLFSSFAYVLVFLKLNIFSYHYLLPAYVFAIIPSVYYFFNERMYRKSVFKFLGFFTLFMIICSNLPTSLHLISHYKNVPHNFQNTLNFLSEYIRENSKDGKRVSLFLYSVDKNTGVEIYHSFIKYLEFNGLNHNKFDVKTDTEDSGILQFVGEKHSPYSVFNQRTPSNVVVGDLIVITPYTLGYIDIKHKKINELFLSYQLLYHAKSFMEIPNLSVKALIKYIASQKKERLRDGKVVVSENIYGLPLDFYVFKKVR